MTPHDVEKPHRSTSTKRKHQKLPKRIGSDEREYVLIFKDFLFEQNDPILRIGENRQQTLNFSVAKSFCSTYFKFWTLLKKLFGFTVPNFGVHQISTLVSIIEKVMIDFFGPPGIRFC